MSVSSDPSKQVQRCEWDTKKEQGVRSPSTYKATNLLWVPYTVMPKTRHGPQPPAFYPVGQNLKGEISKILLPAKGFHIGWRSKINSKSDPEWTHGVSGRIHHIVSQSLTTAEVLMGTCTLHSVTITPCRVLQETWLRLRPPNLRSCSPFPPTQWFSAAAETKWLNYRKQNLIVSSYYQA